MKKDINTMEEMKKMESSVIAVNKHLTDKVKKMKKSELRSNTHPMDAEYFGRVIAWKVARWYSNF